MQGLDPAVVGCIQPCLGCTRSWITSHPPAPSAPPQHNTEPALGHRVGLLVSMSQSCAQHGRVTATVVTCLAGAIAPTLSLCWHSWERGAPWGFQRDGPRRSCSSSHHHYQGLEGVLGSWGGRGTYGGCEGLRVRVRCQVWHSGDTTGGCVPNWGMGGRQLSSPLSQLPPSHLHRPSLP